MLRRVIKSALPLIALSRRQMLVARPVYNMGNIKPSNKNELIGILEEEINLE